MSLHVILLVLMTSTYIYGKANEIISVSRAALPLKNIVIQPENSIWGGGRKKKKSLHSCKRLTSTAAD